MTLTSTPVWYAEYSTSASTLTDKIGGVPTYLPTSFPTSEMTGEELALMLEVFSENVPGLFDDLLCLQIYGPKDLDEPCRTPVLVPVLRGARLNEKKQGTACATLRPFQVKWRKSTEPVILSHRIPPTKAELQYYSTKLGGGSAIGDLPPGTESIGMLTEGEEGFNFGGTVVLLKRDGHYLAELL